MLRHQEQQGPEFQSSVDDGLVMIGGTMRTFVIILGLCALCFAQELNDKDPRAIIEKVKIYRLTQELDLSTEQAEVFFPKLHELQKIEKDFHEQRAEMLHELRGLVVDGDNEDEIIIIITGFEDAQKKKVDTKIQKMEDMWMVLTPVQRAKFLIFEDEFHREIREMIKEVKKHHLERP